MIQDESSLLLPEGAVYSARNVLFDKLGKLRKRGGITGLGATTTYTFDHLGALSADDGTVKIYCSNYGTNEIYIVNTTTGAFTLLTTFGGGFGDIQPDSGRPFSHSGFMVFPEHDSNFASLGAGVTPFVAGGADGSVVDYLLTTPASVAIVAGDKRITVAVADSPLAHMQVGQIFATSNTSFQSSYVGRITRLVSTSQIEVYPTPSISVAAGGAFAARAVNAWVPIKLTGCAASIGGRVGMSYQGRICLGNISRQDTQGINRLENYPRRFQFTSTLLEQDAAGKTCSWQGMVQLSCNAFPDGNYFEIPFQEPLTAMSPTGFGDAVIFSALRAARLTGNLSTQFGDEPSITWAVKEIPNSVGCMSERSLQRSPRGIIFAHDTGVYITDGTSMRPLMYKKMMNDWVSLVAPGNAFAIYGSAIIHNHYYVCGISAGTPWAWMVNLDTLAWGMYTGKAAAPASFLISSSVQDPGNPGRIWGLKWTQSTVPMTGGQLVKLDDIFNPSSANRTDSDGTTVSFEVVTAPYSEGEPSIQKDWLAATVQYNNIGGDGIGVTPAFVLDSADVPAGGTTTQLSKQNVYTVTVGTGAGAIIVLTIGAGHKIAQDAWVRVSGVVGNTNANGLWRVQAVTATTLTLMGSIGNAAYVSGGTVQVVDQMDVSLQAAVPIGGDPSSVVYRINDTDLGTPGSDSFELLAITHTWEDRDTHVE